MNDSRVDEWCETHVTKQYLYQTRDLFLNKREKIVFKKKVWNTVSLRKSDGVLELLIKNKI